jgi:predicted DNA-binding transcriptional regulator AlpA
MNNARKTVAARAPLVKLTDFGHLHICHLMHLLDCSRQTVYGRMRDGTLPQPDGRDGRRPYWLTQTIRPLFERRTVVESCCTVRC